jgi:hypothetical protein
MEAAALLLPKRTGLGSEEIQPWEPWTRPPEPKPIDVEVERQIARRDQKARAPHMRTRAELDAIWIHCPYVHARLAVALATGDGTQDKQANEAAKLAPVGRGIAVDLKDLADEAAELIDRLGAFLKRDASRGLGQPHRPRGARRNHEWANAQLRQVHAAQDQVVAAQEALRILAAAALEGKEALTPSHSTGDLWRQAFVMRIGIAWRSLTGRDPSPSSDHFGRFVAAGFNSLGPGIPTDAAEWRHHITTACERMAKRPEWDRWDREERSTLPPGTIVHGPGEYQKRQRQREERFTADVHALLDARTPEEARAASMKLIEDWSWIPDTPQGQRDLELIQAGRGLKH